MTRIEFLRHKDLLAVVAKVVKDNWSLCGSRWNNCEAEYLAAETIHACHLNATKHEDAFSWLGMGAREVHGNGLINNGMGLERLIRDKSIVQEDYNGPLSAPRTTLTIDGKPQILRCGEEFLHYCKALADKNKPR